MRKPHSFILPAIMALGLDFGATSALAAAGNLDATFGKGGKVVTSFANSAAPDQPQVRSAGYEEWHVNSNVIRSVASVIAAIENTLREPARSPFPASNLRM